MKEINAKTKLTLRRSAKKKIKKTVTAAKKIKFVVVKKTNTVEAKLKKTKVAKKCTIEKKTLKLEMDIKKINNRTAKNFYKTIKKSQIAKNKAILLIIDGNVIKNTKTITKLLI